MKILAAPLGALLLLAACSDLPSGVSTPRPQPATFRTELRCTADVHRPTLDCESDAAGGMGPARSLIIGGQHVYVRLTSSGAGYNPSDSIFSVQVNVQNLMAQMLGTSDGETDTGVRVFFDQTPTPVPSGGSVSVHNADGEAIFLSAPVPYFDYEGLLYPSLGTEDRVWEFKMDPEVTRFVFSVYVQGNLPHESSILLFRPQVEADGFTIVNGFWGPSANEVFAAGFDGLLMRWDGDSWTTDDSPTDAFLWDIWGSSSTDVFAVGTEGTIVRWNGTDWQVMDSGLGEDECGCATTLWSVWGSGPDDVYAVGDGGVVVHYDGTQWTAADTMPVSALYGVWGSGPDDVFVVGDEGGIFHFDGTSWSPMESGLEEGEYLNNVWGLSATDVYAPASTGILHYDGTSWTPLPGADTCEYMSAWGSGPNDLFFTNYCGVHHFDGSTWTYMDPGGFAPTVWGTSSTHVLTNTNGGIYVGGR